MMSRSSPAWAWSIWGVMIALSAVAAGCGAGSYDALRAEYGRSTPADPDSAEDNERISDSPVLEREALVRAVLARSPSIEAARQAWRAAIARYPQARALADPTLSYSLAPATIASDSVDFGQVIEVSQRFPWPGTLQRQGEVALAVARATREDYATLRLRLALLASNLFDEYYVVERLLVLNEQDQQIIADIVAAAELQYQVGGAPRQHALQAEIERLHVIHHRVVLESRRAVVIAQINVLLRRSPEGQLPPPPEGLDLDPDPLPSGESLQVQALRVRPELRAARLRVQGGRAAVELAERRYFPEIGVRSSYNSMWSNPAHQWMVGVSLNVPIQRGARAAAVEESAARLVETRSHLAHMADDIRLEVESARLRLLEAQHVVRLYEGPLLAAVRHQIDAAHIAYQAGQGSFETLIGAERSLRTLQIEHQGAVATLGMRRTALQHALGHVPGMGSPDEEAP